MKLILVRHGLAVEREEFAADKKSEKKDDSLRPLVEKGKDRTLEMAQHLMNWVDEIDILVTSPYTRALQSAQILKKVLKPKNFFEAVELIPSAPPMAFSEWLRRHASLKTTVVAVGHEPQLDTFASWALSGQNESFIRLKKSGALGLEVESFTDIRPQTVEIRFLIHPLMFNEKAKTTKGRL